MKTYLKRIISMVLVISLITTNFAGCAKNGDPTQETTAGEVFTFVRELTWEEAGKQIAGMLSFIVEDAADIDLTAHSERIKNLSLEDDSIYLAILAENGYLPGEPAQIDPKATISTDEYAHLMEIAFPTAVDSQAAIDTLKGVSEPGNIAILGDDLSMGTMLPDRLAVAAAQNLTLTAVKAAALSLNAGASVDLSESEIARVHIRDTAVDAEGKNEPDTIYLHMDSGTQLPEVIVKSADEVVIEGNGALGVVRVQEAVDSLTVRATGSVVNETDKAFKVTGPDAEVVELQPGEQVDFVLSKWLVHFVTEGTPVEVQEIAPGGMVDFSKAVTTLEGKIFTSWYEDAEYTTPVSRLGTVDRQMTLYARFVDEAEAAVVTFETFGGREIEPMVFAKGEYLLTKPVETLYTFKEGYSFGGWCVDEECTTGFGYTDPIEGSMTLYAMYSSYEQEVREDPGTVAEIELPDGAAAIGLVLPEGMGAAEAEKNITVEAGTGLEAPVISVRKTESGAELYCEAGFTPGSTFTLYVQNDVRFAGYPEYIDTLTVSVFREQVEVVQFTEGLTYVLWDNVTGYTPVVNSGIEYTSDYAEDGTVHNVIEDHDAQSDVIPGKLIMTGEVNLQPEQVVVFYDGEIGREEAPVDSWQGGDLAGYVLFAQIQSVETLADGTSQVTFVYADPESYITEMDVHTTEDVDLEENLTQEQIAQIEKTIASQLAANDELKAQMLVAVMTSEDTQRMLDEKYGANTYSLAALVPYVSDPKLDIKVSVKDSTATAGIGVGITVALYGSQGLMVTLSPYLYFEEQLTLKVNVDGGFLWLDMSVLFNTKTTVSLQLKVTTGDGMGILDEAKNTLEEIVQADGTAIEGYDYQEAADTLMNTMQELIDAEVEYQDLFGVPLLKYRYPFYGIIFFGVDVELVGQAGVVATFGVTVTAEYGQKIGFNYNFLKAKGGSYKEKLASEVTTEIYLIGKIGVRVGIAVTLSVSILHKVTVSITGSIYAYVELAGMFMYTYALSAGGGNYAGALYVEVGIDIEIELGIEVEVFVISYEKTWTLWSHRWPLYSKSVGMTMSVVQTSELKEMWDLATSEADIKTVFTIPYIPMKSYDMLTAECTENQLLFENLREGNVTARLTLENIRINGEPVSADDPRAAVFYVGDGENGKLCAVYADELKAAANKVTNYDCDVVLTYQNKNKSELIKNYRMAFPLSREFKMATTTVNVDIALYDWCAHAWGIEEAEWEHDVVFETTFENTHVLGCPVEPSTTGTIDLDAVIASVKERYPEIDGTALSWFNPTLNEVDRTVQYSIPRISNMCYLTPNSDTVRYDLFATTTEYDLTFNLFASRYPGHSSEITYIIEGPEAPAGTVFTVTGSDAAQTMTFQPMAGEEHRWSLTTDRSAFNGTERPIMMRLDGGSPVASGLVITGRESESVVILTLGSLSSKLTVETGEGIASWELVNHEPSQLTAMIPGETVTISVELLDGYEEVRLISEPEGLEYTTHGTTVTFTMPSYDVTITLEGVRYYRATFQYNYGDLETYRIVKVEKGKTITKPADPYVKGLTFAGWYDNAACEEKAFDFTTEIYKDITLYADWRVNVTVDFNGPKGRAAYVVDRWYEEVDGMPVEVVKTEPIFPGDETEYARYTYATHKVGETGLDYLLPNYDGHDFFGWYLTSDCSGEPVNPEEYVLTGGVTFYARWEKTAVLTYELNYGEPEKPYSMALEHVGMPVQNIPADPQREHYEFLGWFRAKNGGEANRVDLNSYVVEGDMTLYACWKPVEYTITYELGGGENAPGNPVSHSIESGSLPIFDPTRTGYNFLGWDVTGIDALEADGKGGVCIPAGSVGNITLTAKWEPIVYTITIDLVRGETAEPNPDKYTVESEEIVLKNPTAEGYDFVGWTGTGLTEKTLTVVIPTGSVGNRSYKANWLPTDPVGRIVANALDAIPDEYTMPVRLDEFNGVEDFVAEAMALLAKDEDCTDYLDQLTVSVEQLMPPTVDYTSHYYPVRVTVTYTDDSGVETTDSKVIALYVLKKAVDITASITYPEGSLYIPYGTKLGDLTLTGTAVATATGETVSGTFSWEDETIVATAANNGQEVYKVVFIPDEELQPEYSTAEILLAVNTQIGLQLKLDVPDTMDYSFIPLCEWPVQDFNLKVKLYLTDYDTGETVTDVTIADYNGSNVTFAQDSMELGPAKIWVTRFDESALQTTDPDLYVLIGKDGQSTADSFTIVKAVPRITVLSSKYTATVGDKLSDIAIQMTASDAHDPLFRDLAGTISWQYPSVELDQVGTYRYFAIFTPEDTEHYSVFPEWMTVTVRKGTVTIPTVPSAVYNGKLQKPSMSDTDYYTVEVNNGGTDAGGYTVTLKLKDAANYKWSDGDESETKDLTFTISPAPLYVGTGYSVAPLGYGQQLVGGKDTHTDKVNRSASDILSGAEVTMVDNTTVAGWWEWTDENYVGKTLNASSVKDNNDYGDGYQVLATFHPTSLNASNFVTLEQTFLVEIERATPYIKDGGCIKEGDIYMPADEDPVARLSYFTPVLKSNALNPNSDQVVSGSLKWELDGESDRIPKKTETSANAKFIPDDPKNYKSDVEVEVALTYKAKLTAHFVSGDPFLYKIVALNPGSTNSVDRTWDPVGDGRIQFIMVLNDDTMGKICPYRFTVTDSKGNKILQTSFPGFNPETREPTMVNDLIGPAIMNTAPGAKSTDGSYGYYYLTLPGDKYSLWNCTDINVYVQFGSIDDSGWKNVWGGNVYYEGFTSYEQYISSGSSYSLRSRSLAPAAMLEPAMDLIPEPIEEPVATPEPGAIGDVVTVKPKQEAQKSGGVWRIPLEEDQELVEFQWEASKYATEYLVYTMDESGDQELIARTTECSIKLSVEDYENGCNTLYVGAVLEDGSVTWGEAKFQLMPFTEPDAEPTEPVEEEPTEPDTEPTEPDTEPTEPATEPTEPDTEPTEPATEPTEPPTEPTEPAIEPTEPATEPTEPATEPTEPAAEPVEPTPEPTTPEPAPSPAPEPAQETQADEEAA